MAIESAEDLAALFHPDDFGVAMVCHHPDASVAFNGVLTTGAVANQPGSTADISMMVLRIIALKSALPLLAQNDYIEFANGKRVIVNDVQYKGELIIIFYHEHW